VCHRRIRRLAGLVAIVVAMLFGWPGVQQGGAAGLIRTAVSVDPAVERTLQDAGSAPVIVELNEEPLRPAERADRQALRARMRAAHARVVATLPGGDFQLTHLYEGLPAFAGVANSVAVDRLRASPYVRSITLDGQGQGALTESVPLINADDVQNTLGYTGAGVIVAVLDTGVDRDHPDFAGAIAYEECWLLDGTCPGGGTHTSGPGSGEGDHFHGSNVSGIITSNGVVAPKGVAAGAQIAVYKILNASNLGFFSDWNAALSDIIANHPEVDAVNMSLVDNVNHTAACDSYQPTTTTAIDTLRSLGVATFVSSGNNRFTNGITFPACVDSAISVGAVYDGNIASPVSLNGCTETPAVDTPTCWSNSASFLDILAPGAFTLSVGLAGGLSVAAGTSMAAPHAAGVAALMLDASPGLTPSTIESVMEATGVPRLDPKNGLTKPRIDAYAATVEVTDPDNDGLPSVLDNCPDDANPGQENTDRNFIDQTPPSSQDDRTWPNSDAAGDACDTDDDNDGILDVDEAAGCNGSGPLQSTNRDTDGDRFLDGAECAIGTNPADPGSKPTIAQCAAFLGVASTLDTDGDRLRDHIEFCNYNTDPNDTDTDGDQDGYPTTGLAKDGCEAASLNNDRVVNAGDQLLMVLEIIREPAPSLRLVSFDVNKDGAVNAGDQLILAQFISASGQCP